MKKTAAFVLMLVCVMFAQSALALTVTGLESDSVGRKWETNLFFSRMEALTGVAAQAHGVEKKEDYAKLLEQMKSGVVEGGMADVLFKANLTREDEYALLDSGALIDLAPMIDAHMPNLSALLAANPEWKEIIALEDGRIASLPLINREERQVLVWLNKAWLDTLGVAVPATIDELTDALVKIKDGDPNKNGKGDEVAADLVGVYELRWLLPYFGVVADDYHLARNEAGELVFAPELPAYRSFMEKMREWYELGVLPKEAFTAAHSSALLSEQDEKAALTSGMLVSMTPYTHVPVDHVMEYVPVLLAGPDGAVRWRDLLGEVWTGCFAVTSACQDPAQALEWVDALYDEENMKLGYAGVEGEDYTITDAGYWAFVLDHGRDISTIRSNVLMYTGAEMPGLYPADFVQMVDSEIDRHVFAASEQARAVSEQVTQPYCLTRDNQQKANALAAEIGALVDTGIGRFVTGEVELSDETYGEWIAQMQAAGSAELVALFAQAE